MNYHGDDDDGGGGGKATPLQLSPAHKMQRLNSVVTDTVAPGYWFNNNSMTYGSNPMTYGIGAGNSSTLGHGTGGNVQFHLGSISRNLFDDSRMNPFGDGGGMGPYGLMMQHHSVFSPYAQASTSTHSSSYTQTHQTQPEEIIKKMAVLVNLPRQVVYAVVPCNYLLVVKLDAGKWAVICV